MIFKSLLLAIHSYFFLYWNSQEVVWVLVKLTQIWIILLGENPNKSLIGEQASTLCFRGALDHPAVPPLADVILMKAYSNYCLLCTSAVKWILVCSVIYSPHQKNCKILKQGTIFRRESVFIFFFRIGLECTVFAVICHLLLFSSVESTPSSALEIYINRLVSYFYRLAIWSCKFFSCF